MTIGDRIKNRRKFLKMSADELGKRLGKDRSTIYRYEKGDIENLPLDILEPIAYALETTPQYLMGWEEKTAPEIGSGLSKAKQQLLDLAENCSEDEAERLLQVFELILGKK
jgi:transcriptional regulator with XRE-family HTH domain